MIDPKMIEVIMDGETGVGVRGLAEMTAQRLHDAGFRRVPSEDEIQLAISQVELENYSLNIRHKHRVMVAQAIRKLMLGVAQGGE